MGEIKINAEKCKGCELCIHFCPKGCITVAESFNSRGYKPGCFTKKDDCIGCAICARVCPDIAIEVWR